MPWDTRVRRWTRQRSLWAWKAGGLKVSLVEKGRIVDGVLDQAKEIMSGDTIIINIDLGLGSAQARGFGCDLTHEYVNVNANYTT